MSEITYFQKYSKQEDHTTNNTLLMLRHLYKASPRDFELLIRKLLGGTHFSIGPTFMQQTNLTASRLDGDIVQKGFTLSIETKEHQQFELDQLQRHMDGLIERKAALGGSTECVLIALSKDRCRKEIIEDLTSSEKYKGVQFVAQTFEELLTALQESAETMGGGLTEVVEDFGEYLASSGLLSNRMHWMVAFPCGQSWEENVKCNVYFEPEERSPKWQGSAYVGIYHDKMVSHIGKIKAVVVYHRPHDQVDGIFKREDGDLVRQEDKDQILATIRACSYYTLDSYPHRYYLVDNFVETTFRKDTPGGMVGHRYFNLVDREVIDKEGNASTEEIAEKLRTNKF